MKDDTISRAAALDAFLTELTKRERKNFLHTWSTVEVKYFVADMLEKLSSAQPDKWDDTVYRKAVEMLLAHFVPEERYAEAVDGLRRLPSAQLAQDLTNGCTDTISRAAALSALNGLTEIYLNNLPPTIDRADAVEAIEALPSAQRWIPCSECEKRCDKWEHSKI